MPRSSQRHRPRRRRGDRGRPGVASAAHRRSILRAQSRRTAAAADGAESAPWLWNCARLGFLRHSLTLPTLLRVALRKERSPPCRITTSEPKTSHKLIAEALGTFLLVFGSIGTALFASDFGVGAATARRSASASSASSLAFGLTLMAGIYTWGPISGGHFNPAVTFGLAAAGRFAWKDAPGYIIAQVIGGAVGHDAARADRHCSVPTAGSARAGRRLRQQRLRRRCSPGGFGLGAAIIAEILFTARLPHRDPRCDAPAARHAGFAGLAIGLTLTFIHLASIPIDNTSVNPARSIATAIYGGPDALLQLWVFIVFPLVGGVLAGFLHRALFEPRGTVGAGSRPRPRRSSRALRTLQKRPAPEGAGRFCVAGSAQVEPVELGDLAPRRDEVADELLAEHRPRRRPRRAARSSELEPKTRSARVPMPTCSPEPSFVPRNACEPGSSGFHVVPRSSRFTKKSFVSTPGRSVKTP